MRFPAASLGTIVGFVHETGPILKYPPEAGDRVARLCGIHPGVNGPTLAKLREIASFVKKTARCFEGAPGTSCAGQDHRKDKAPAALPRSPGPRPRSRIPEHQCAGTLPEGKPRSERLEAADVNGGDARVIGVGRRAVQFFLCPRGRCSAASGMRSQKPGKPNRFYVDPGSAAPPPTPKRRLRSSRERHYNSAPLNGSAAARWTQSLKLVRIPSTPRGGRIATPPARASC